MKGKLIAVSFNLRTYIETSSLSAEFVNKNRCIGVRLVSEVVKSIEFDNFENSHNSFLTRIFHRLFLWKWIPCQAVTSVLCLPFRPKTVHCNTKDAYTSENFPCISTLLSTNSFEFNPGKCCDPLRISVGPVYNLIQAKAHFFWTFLLTFIRNNYNKVWDVYVQKCTFS